ncbi:PKD domain-containing protein [Formosa sp. 3Alg 14/1]|uniref:PKD domain-containing protein n=1 Tax=unclassified Formosa TaxID=2644710 RepID=UPI0039BE2258
MKKHLFKLKYIVLGAFVSLTACVSDDLPEVGDLPDITGPQPFYSYSDISTSEFDCNDVELEANYDFFLQAGTNLAVNGTQYQWEISPSENVNLINKDQPIIEQQIEGELATVVALEDEIAKVEFKIPCETDPAKIAVLEQQVADLEVQLAAAEAAVTDETKANVAALEAQLAALPAGTLQDREVIVEFPGPGEYTVGLTVTDNLGKSDYTEKIIVVSQAIPTIAIPEIGEAGFEAGDLFDGSGDGRDSWRSPSSSKWGSVFQINTKSELGVLPEGYKAAKFPSDGTRVGYQEIDVTPGATYVLSYFSSLDPGASGDLTVSIVNPNAQDIQEARLEANILAFKTEDNAASVQDVFKKNAITFEAGELESVIILITNSGTESRVDAFDITVKQ